MGDLDSSTSTTKENGQSGFASVSPWPAETENPRPSSIPDETWILAEKTITHVITKIQPTKLSDERRRNVVEYIQKIVKTKLGCEVFPYGSVPLKTYLPDGDIDLTAIDTSGLEDSLTGNLSSVLEAEEQHHNKDSEFKLKDVQTIHAEVRLVKCLVQNIVVDISCDQIGGLSTLCFLDEVSVKIGKDNLFKRTIILIKAWCYYESRILGAHHSLISTYALETLVLYIFHLFHSSLDGPLAVLYRFLDYFSKFDWDNLSVSMHSPVVEGSKTDRDELLLSGEFLSKCADDYYVHPKVSETNRLFVKKYLNIVDPLKENNNLGRSVSEGNLYRIRSAFAYGARKLGKILTSSKKNMPNELRMFFKNTLERHGNGERSDMQNTVLDVLNVTNDNLPVFSSSSNGNIVHGGTVDLNGTKTSLKESEKGLENVSALMLDLRYIKENDTSASTGVSHPSTKVVCLPPHLICSDVKKISKNDVNGNKLASRCSNPIHSSSNRAPDSSDCSFNRKQKGNRDFVTSQGKESSDKEETPSDCGLADLSGESVDHQLHLNNLHYAQYVHFNRSISSQNNISPYPPTGQLYPPVNGYFSNPSFPNYYGYTMNPGFVPQHPYVIDETQKHRGTGTYIPTAHNQRTFRDKLLMAGRGRNQPFFPNMMPRPGNNGRPVAPLESNMTDARVIPVLGVNGRGHSGQFNFSQAPIIPLPRRFPQINGHIHSLDSQLQFQTLDSPITGSPNQEYDGNPESKSPHTHHISSTVVSSSIAQKSGTSSNMERCRLAQSYWLKDNDEFPPLSN